jgi:uncharacterized protein DUF6894
MPLYFFRIRNGPYSGASDQGTELADRKAAWKELTGVCADMVGSIARNLKEDAEWANGASGRDQKAGFPNPPDRGNPGRNPAKNTPLPMIRKR